MILKLFDIVCDVNPCRYRRAQFWLTRNPTVEQEGTSKRLIDDLVRTERFAKEFCRDIRNLRALRGWRPDRNHRS